MHVLEALETLIDNILLVNIFKDVGPDYSVQVRVHEVKNEVYVPVIFCPDDIL